VCALRLTAAYRPLGSGQPRERWSHSLKDIFKEPFASSGGIISGMFTVSETLPAVRSCMHFPNRLEHPINGRHHTRFHCTPSDPIMRATCKGALDNFDADV